MVIAGDLLRIERGNNRPLNVQGIPIMIAQQPQDRYRTNDIDSPDVEFRLEDEPERRPTDESYRLNGSISQRSLMVPSDNQSARDAFDAFRVSPNLHDNAPEWHRRDLGDVRLSNAAVRSRQNLH